MENKIKQIILDILNNSGKEVRDIDIKETTKLRDDLGLDSFNLAELTVHIENEFDVDVFEDGLIETVGEIYQKIEV